MPTSSTLIDKVASCFIDPLSVVVVVVVVIASASLGFIFDCRSQTCGNGNVNHST